MGLDLAHPKKTDQQIYYQVCTTVEPTGPGAGEGGTSIYGLYRYVPQDRGRGF